MKIFEFKDIPSAPLLIDAVYKGGTKGNIGDEPIHHLFNLQNTSGFRFSSRNDKKGYAYVAIFSSFNVLEWPDYVDRENGIVRYYGDNHEPGKALTDKKGNRFLEDVFNKLNNNDIKNIPPILLFEQTGNGHDTKFLGLIVPGTKHLNHDKELVAIWRTKNGERFQNYEAYFTILNTKTDEITKEWLHALKYEPEKSIKLAPIAWKKFMLKGRDGITPLCAPKITEIRTPEQQEPDDDEGNFIIKTIIEYYNKELSYSQGFEKCAAEIVRMMDNNFRNIELTRPTRDGGRDAIAEYHVGPAEHPIKLNCYIEAKCYRQNNGVGVKETSRLISRIKNREFGIMVTTSYVNSQAYSEIIEDGHPILILSGKDISDILRRNGIGKAEIKEWLINLSNSQ